MSKKDKSTLLSGHKRKGKILMSPFSSLEGRSKPSSWSNRFPEFIWISLIMHHFGLKDGMRILGKIASKLKENSEWNKEFDFTMSMFKDKISENQIENILQALTEKERRGILLAFSPLLIYPKNPLDYVLQSLMEKSFLSIDCNNYVAKEFYAQRMGGIVVKLLSRHSRLSAETNAAFLYMHILTEKTKFIQCMDISLKNIKEPEGSEKFLQGAMFVNDFSKIIWLQSSKKWWSKYFWDINLKNTICFY